MYTIIVRAKKDSDAVKAMLRIYYSGWNIRVKTLKGVRSLEQFYDKLLENIDEEHFNIVLVGREDADKMKLELSLPLNICFSLVPKEKVRNARLPTIREAFERGRAKFRNIVYWNEAYIFSWSEGLKLGIEPLPVCDNFMFFGERGIRLLSQFLGELKGVLLLVRKLGGEHEVYSGPHLIGKIKIPDSGEVSGSIFKHQEVYVDVNEVVKRTGMYSRYTRKSLWTF